MIDIFSDQSEEIDEWPEERRSRRQIDETEASYRINKRPAAGQIDTELAELAQTSLTDFFGAQGPIARLLPEYELRPSQLRMAELVKQLASKEPHYIRCVKPNEEKSSSAFDMERVEHQVRQLFTFRAIRLEFR